MTEEQWQKAWRLYQLSDGLPADQIDSFLDSSDPEPAVRAAVRAMMNNLQPAEEKPANPLEILDWSGRKIGRYVVTQHLADGGMGEVYMARDTELERSVAIKFLSAGVTGAVSLQRFIAEAKAASALNHPNIVTVYEVIHSDSRLAMVMELIDGMALRKLCGSPVPVDRLFDLAAQISKALAAAHARGIVHCDIKPENLLVRPDGLVKVLDFGLARDLAVISSTSLASAGTLRYMSPEQSQGQRPSAASDIFSLGIVLYELSTGVHPFEEGSMFETLNALNRAQPVAPMKLNPFLPHPWDNLIKRMLEKDPVRRPTAAELGQLLETRFGDQTRGPANRRASAENRTWLEQLNRRTSVLAGLAAMALVAAILIWAFRNTGTKSTPESPLVQLDLDVGDELSQFAISPDGEQIVLLRRDQLCLRRLDEGTIRPLPGTEGASYPFFSPDGKWVAFFAGGKLQKIAVEGGSPVTICDAQSGRGGSWNQDGQIVAALKSTGGLAVVASSGGAPRPFTELKRDESGVTSHRWPQVLPHERGTLFTATIAGGAIGSLCVLPGRGGTMRTLVDNSPYGRFLAGGFLVYYRDGRLFAVPFDLNSLQITGPAVMLADHVAADTTRGAIFEISLSGVLVYRRGDDNASLSSVSAAGDIQQLPAKPETYLTPRLSPDGRRLALSVAQGGEQNLWIYDLDSRVLKRITFDSEPQLFPVWTPDGNFIVFRSGSSLAWVRADGKGPVEHLQTNSLNPLPYSISQDNKWLTFGGDSPSTGLDLYVAAVEHLPDGLHLGQLRTLLRQTGGQYAPAISPDNRWLAYTSDESGRGEVYVKPFAADGSVGTGKWQVSNEGGVYPVWSHRGDHLFYRGADRRVMEVNYSIKGSSFISSKPSVWTTRRLGTAAGLPSFDLEPDGSRMIGVFETADSTKEVVLRVLLNVDGELRRRSTDGWR